MVGAVPVKLEASDEKKQEENTDGPSRWNPYSPVEFVNMECLNVAVFEREMYPNAAPLRTEFDEEFMTVVA